ncbi:hypothetical protein [Sporosarcina saromensis]|nr:hypothetical protein [Sporosarcina saromensis]
MYVILVAPSFLFALLIILFSNADSKNIYAASIQAVGLAGYYVWRMFHRRKEKLKNNG